MGQEQIQILYCQVGPSKIPSIPQQSQLKPESSQIVPETFMDTHTCRSKNHDDGQDNYIPMFTPNDVTAPDLIHHQNQNIRSSVTKEITELTRKPSTSIVCIDTAQSWQFVWGHWASHKIQWTHGVYLHNQWMLPRRSTRRPIDAEVNDKSL